MKTTKKQFKPISATQPAAQLTGMPCDVTLPYLVTLSDGLERFGKSDGFDFGGQTAKAAAFSGREFAVNFANYIQAANPDFSVRVVDVRKRCECVYLKVGLFHMIGQNVKAG